MPHAGTREGKTDGMNPARAAGLPVPVAPPAPVPTPLPQPPELPARRGPARRGWRRLLFPALLLVLAAAGGVWWQQHRQPEMPAGFAWGNGRIEADEIDIATKFAGRVAGLLVEEGEMVKAGQVLARMDVRDLQASMNRAEAQVLQADKNLEAARATVEQQKSRLQLAEQEIARSRFLFEKGYRPKEILDQRQSERDAAAAALAASEAQAGQAGHGLEAARQEVALIRVNIADNTLVAPRDGRIQYRLAMPGEVLGAGGKVFTMLDIFSVYMDIFLPTAEAGRAALGTEARILLDALPDRPIPARVSFVAAQAQFTPKAVETRSERDKLMFRVRVRIDPDLLRAKADRVRTGLPGVAWVRLDPKAEWPARLQPKAM